MLFEIVKDMLNPVEIANLYRKKRLNNLGGELFRFYINLNELLTCGSDILNILEQYSTSSRLSGLGGPFGPSTETLISNSNITRGFLAPKIQEQAVNIRRVIKQLEKFSEELDILDAQLKKRIEVLVDGKVGFLSQLSRILTKGNLILIPDGEYYHNMQKVFNNPPTYMFTELLQFNHKRLEIFNDLPWTYETNQAIKTYIETQQARKQLENGKEAIQQLHSILKDTFSIQDILIDTYGKKKL